jgi:magnesium-transporting ATPase (P-type)
VSASGLTTAEAKSREATSGANVLPRVKKKGPLDLIWRQLKSTLTLVLLASGLLALAFSRITDGSVVVAVVALNALIGAFQEYRAGRAIESLDALVPETITALRDGGLAPIAAAEIVPGDIVLIEAGDRMPADMRVLAVRQLRVTEAALTGESVPTAKQVEPVAKDAALGERASMLFSGTIAVAGTATAVVVATGVSTELGRISAMLRDTRDVETPLTHSLRRFGNILTAAIGAVAYFVLVTAWRRGYPFVDAVRAAVSLVVAAVPSSLPAIITVALAVAVRRMAKRNAIVRTLPSIETLGSTNVICSDKTGTLTQGEMLARALWTGAGAYELSGAGVCPEGQLSREGSVITAAAAADVLDLLQAVVLCNDAELRRNQGSAWEGVGDPTEVALVVAAGKVGVDAGQMRARLPRLDAIPFDPTEKYMATLHRLDGDRELVVVKGAPEVVLKFCTGHGFDPAEATAMLHLYAARGMRVLAVASRERAEAQRRLEPSALAPLRLLGLIASVDPPRPGVMAAIATCKRSGITVKMVTGDHPSTAKAVGVEIGIADPADRVMRGDEIDHMPPEQLEIAARFVNVFSRVAPEHKLRLVRALQARGDVVAMTGDGVNDAPALKQADVGIAMGRAGTAAAQEAAAMVLVDDDFASIAAAVEGGRRCYDCLVKALMFVVPTNLGQSLVLLVGVVAFPVIGGVPLLPVVPLQILWVNLVTGVTLAVPLAFEEAEPDLMERPPRPRKEPLFSRKLAVRCIIVGTVMAVGAIGLFLDEFYGEIVMPRLVEDVALRKAQTVAATTIVLFQIFYLLQCRSLRMSSIAARTVSNPAIYAGIILTLLFQVAFVHAPFMNVIFHSSPLRLRDWLASAAVAMSVLPVMALEKAVYERRGLPRASRGAPSPMRKTAEHGR